MKRKNDDLANPSSPGSLGPLSSNLASSSHAISHQTLSIHRTPSVQPQKKHSRRLLWQSTLETPVNRALGSSNVMDFLRKAQNKTLNSATIEEDNMFEDIIPTLSYQSEKGSQEGTVSSSKAKKEMWYSHHEQDTYAFSKHLLRAGDYNDAIVSCTSEIDVLEDALLEDEEFVDDIDTTNCLLSGEQQKVLESMAFDQIEEFSDVINASQGLSENGPLTTQLGVFERLSVGSISSLHITPKKSEKNEFLDSENLEKFAEINQHLKEDRAQAFRTASGKPVVVSNEAIKNAKEMVDEVDRFDNQNSGPKIAVQIRDEQGDRAVAIQDLTEFEIKSNEINVLNLFEGFKTGLGKHISVSNEAIEQVQNLVDDIDELEQDIDQSNITDLFAGLKSTSSSRLRHTATNKVTGLLREDYDLHLVPVTPQTDGILQNSSRQFTPLTCNFNPRSSTALNRNTNAFNMLEDVKTSDNVDLGAKESLLFSNGRSATPLSSAWNQVNDIFGDLSSMSSKANESYPSAMYTPITAKVKHSAFIPPSNTKKSLFDTPLPKRAGLLPQCRKSQKPFVTPRKAVATPKSAYKPFKVLLTPGITPSTLKESERVTLNKKIKSRKPGIKKVLGEPFLSKLPENCDPILVSVDREVFEAYCFSADEQSWGHSQASLDLKLVVKYPNLVNEAWVKLQYGLILWKMASYCRAYPQMIDSYWTVEMIKKQLLFKFEKEYIEAQRPALRLICEKDDIPSRLLVLCVSKIYIDETSCFLEVTDGWYYMKALVDEDLSSCIREGKIYVGLKLSVHGAKILGLTEACSPLELSGNVTLSMNYNSTRRARSDTKLGYQKLRIFTTNIASLSKDGGPCPCLDVIICRRYAVQYMENLPGGERIFRNQKDEDAAVKQYQNHFDRTYQSLKAKLQKEKSIEGNIAISDKSSTEYLYYIFTTTNDIPDFMKSLSAQDRARLEEFIEKNQKQKQQDDQELIMSKLEDVCPKRNVMRLLKLKICDYPLYGTDIVKCTEAYLTMWQFDEYFFQMSAEGTRVKLYQTDTYSNKSANLLSLKSTNLKYQFCQSSGKVIASSLYTPRVYLSSLEILKADTDVLGKEIDIIVKVQHVKETEYGITEAYCIDHKNITIILYIKKTYGAASSAIRKILYVGLKDVQVISITSDVIRCRYTPQSEISYLKTKLEKEAVEKLRVEFENYTVSDEGSEDTVILVGGLLFENCKETRTGANSTLTFAIDDGIEVRCVECTSEIIRDALSRSNVSTNPVKYLQGLKEIQIKIKGTNVIGFEIKTTQECLNSLLRIFPT